MSLTFVCVQLYDLQIIQKEERIKNETGENETNNNKLKLHLDQSDCPCWRKSWEKLYSRSKMVELT